MSEGYIGRDGAVYRTWEERSQADARHKQHENELKELNKLKLEQEKNNELIALQMEEERENAKRIAEATIEATKQAEEDRYQNEYWLETVRQKNLEKLEQLKQENEEINRYTKLCDEIGVDYEEIMKFVFAINNCGSRELLEKMAILKKEQLEAMSKVQKFLNNKKPEGEKIEKEITDLEEMLKKEKEKYNSKLRESTRLALEQKEILEKKETLFQKVQMLLFIQIKLEKENKIKDIQQKIEFNEKELNDLKLNIEVQEKELIKNKELKDNICKLPPDLEKEWKMFLDKSDEAHKVWEQNEQFKKDRVLVNKFNEFRKNHYNEEIERLFRKLDLGFDYIKEDDIHSLGTLSEYIKYMEKFIYDPIYKNELNSYDSYSYRDIIEMNKLGIGKYEERYYNNDENKTIEDISETEIDEKSVKKIDQLLEKAIKLVIETGQASTSFIQREFKIGYSKAGEIIDEMEEMGIITGYDGIKPRKVLTTIEEWEKIKKNML